jgi:hypothetical protein
MEDILSMKNEKECNKSIKKCAKENIEDILSMKNEKECNKSIKMGVKKKRGKEKMEEIL